MSAVFLEKIVISCRLALSVNKDGTTKMRKQRNVQNEKTEVVQKNGISNEIKLERSSK